MLNRFISKKQVFLMNQFLMIFVVAVSLFAADCVPFAIVDCENNKLFLYRNGNLDAKKNLPRVLESNMLKSERRNATKNDEPA